MLDVIIACVFMLSCMVAFVIVECAIERAHRADMQRLRDEIDRM